MGWRINLLREFAFYIRVCQNWQAVIAARRNGSPLEEFRLRGGQVVGFEGKPPFIIFRDIWDKQAYFQDYSYRSARPATVVDIGANVGFFTLLAARLWPQAMILAFEPAPSNFQCLQENVARSRASNVRAYPLAVSGHKGSATLHIKQEGGWHSLVDETGALSEIKVQTVDLDDVLAECAGKPIDFLKMDCEGAEYAILEGKQALIRHAVKHIAMEYHESNAHHVGQLAELLQSAGFSVRTLPLPRYQTGMLIARNEGFSGNGAV